MRSGRLLAIALVVVLVTVAGLVVKAARTSTEVIQTNGVPTLAVVGYARPGVAICQEGVALREPTRELGIWGTGRLAPSPAFRVTVTETGQDRVLARGRGDAAPVESRQFRIPLDRQVSDARPITVCVRSEGRRLLGLIGQIPNYAEGPFAAVTPRQEVLRRVRDNGRTTELEGDMRIEAFRSPPTTTLERLPAALSRAAEFKPAGVVPALWWVALALLVVGAPVALARALRSARLEDHARDDSREPRD